MNAAELLIDNEYLFIDFPTQHSYRAIYLGIKKFENNKDYNIHEFRVFPRTICLNKPFTLRLLECEIDKSSDIKIEILKENDRWN